MKEPKTDFKVECVDVPPCDLGEGPLYDDRSDCLYWVDISGKRLCLLELTSGRFQEFPLPAQPGCLFLTGEVHVLLMALKNGLIRFDTHSGEIRPLGNPFQLPDDIRYNDGKTGPGGTLWAGTMALDGSANKGAFHHIASASEAEQLFDGLTVPNGLAWNQAETAFYHIDSPSRKVTRYPYDKEANRIDVAAGEVCLDLTHLAPAVPDGMTIDTEDRLWIAFWNGSCVRCYDPAHGVCEAVITLPASRITSCCFAGAGLRDLYVTSARQGFSEEELRAQPDAGGLFRVVNAGLGRLAYQAVV